MQSVMKSTLSKWGNSQGIRIPREICDLLGVGVGSSAKIEVDQARSQMTVSFDTPRRKYHRNRKISLVELCGDWEGEKVGDEWGGPDVGAEIVR